jgi:hypothetical protein
MNKYLVGVGVNEQTINIDAYLTLGFDKDENGNSIPF